MELTLELKGVVATPGLEELIRKKLRKLERILPRAASARAHLEIDGFLRIAEITLTAGWVKVRGRGEGKTMESALTDAIAKIRTQVAKKKR